MPYLPSLPADATLRDVFRRFPAVVDDLLSLHETLLRGESPLSVGERELIAAYVSGLNQCGYCHRVHAATAETFGVDPAVLERLLQNVDAGDISAELRPILRYVRKLTLEPAKLTPGDARAVLDAGWQESALFQAVMICAMFNFMNRMVSGLGIELREGWDTASGRTLHDVGYAGLAKLLTQKRRDPVVVRDDYED